MDQSRHDGTAGDKGRIVHHFHGPADVERAGPVGREVADTDRMATRVRARVGRRHCQSVQIQKLAQSVLQCRLW